MPDQAIEAFRSYLLLLARVQIYDQRSTKVEPSDIVQQTLLEAHTAPPPAGFSTGQIAEWLHRALANNIRDAARHARRKKRDIARELSLDELLQGSREKLTGARYAAGQSPAQQAIHTEDLLRLADAVERLPDAQRTAVILHHLQRAPLKEVAARMERAEGAVAGLLHRGLRRLRQELSTPP